MKPDILVVVCIDDIELLKLQIESVIQYISFSSFNKYVIIVNGTLEDYLRVIKETYKYRDKFCSQLVIESLNQYVSKDDLNISNGYLMQQCLKLLYSRRGGLLFI